MPNPYPKAHKAFPRLRQSLLGEFANCGLTTNFSLKYARDWDTHPQARGQLIHRTLARCLEEMHLHNEKTIEVDVALAILHECLRQADVDDVCHQPGCDLPVKIIPPSRRRKDGRSLLCADGHRHHTSVVNIPTREIAAMVWQVAKWAKDNTWDIAHLVSVEERLATTVTYPNPSGGSVDRILTGQLDALFVDPHDHQHAIVLDHKSTWALPALTEVSFTGYHQQRWYAMLVMDHYRDVNKVTLREFYLNYSQTREATIFRDQLDGIRAEFSALAERFDRTFEKQTWKPTPGHHCQQCVRPTACPIPVFTRGEGKITSQGQAERTAAQLLVAEVVVKQATTALRAYCDTHGPVDVAHAKGQAYFGFKPVPRTARPKREDVEMAVAQGRDPSTLYKTNTVTRFGKYVRKPDEMPEVQDEKLLAAMKASVDVAVKKAS